jgi:hypothetical protein
MIKVEEGTGGGLMQEIPGGPAGWLSYVGVDDIRAATKKAESLGAEVMKDVTEMPALGWLSFIRDPPVRCSDCGRLRPNESVTNLLPTHSFLQNLGGDDCRNEML